MEAGINWITWCILFYLFMLAMAALSCLLRRAREGGYLFGFKVNGRHGEGVEVSHLLFVDDSLVFSNVFRTESVVELKKLLVHGSLIEPTVEPQSNW